MNTDKVQKMNKRQKLFVISTVIVVLMAALVTAFYSYQNEPEEGKLKVVATFYPLAFFAQQIGGEEVTVKQLIPDNTEVHNWQPTLAEIVALDEADLILYNGASLDHWFEDDLLPIIDSSNKIILETTEGIQLLETGQENYLEHGHEGVYDPHTWISPFIAKQQAQKIYEAMKQKDPIHSDYYDEGWQGLKTRFEELDNSYMNGLSIKEKDDVFVSHSAFEYLACRYGFTQHGIIGIAADEQPSASRYANLVELMQEYETYTVYVDPVYSTESAQTLRNDLERLSGVDVQILKLYFMLGNIDGLDYFGQMQKNLENLKIGLEAQLE
jgi:zinc transport system substrate-binding protein